MHLQVVLLVYTIGVLLKLRLYQLNLELKWPDLFLLDSHFLTRGELPSPVVVRVVLEIQIPVPLHVTLEAHTLREKICLHKRP